MDAAKYICSEKHLNCKITQISLKKTLQKPFLFIFHEVFGDIFQTDLIQK